MDQIPAVNRRAKSRKLLMKEQSRLRAAGLRNSWWRHPKHRQQTKGGQIGSHQNAKTFFSLRHKQHSRAATHRTGEHTSIMYQITMNATFATLALMAAILAKSPRLMCCPKATRQALYRGQALGLRSTTFYISHSPSIFI